MSLPPAIDESIISRMPQPVAQRMRAARTDARPLERALSAYYVWEVGMRLLSSVAIIEFAESGTHDIDVDGILKPLARPAIGHWWGILRELTPRLAKLGDDGFALVNQVLLGGASDRLPASAGLYGVIDEIVTQSPAGSRSKATVDPARLFDHLCTLRNREIGHGFLGARSDDIYDRLASALLAGMGELWQRINMLAGRRLVYVSGVQRQTSGAWKIERFELVGDYPKELTPLELFESNTDRLPITERLYLMPGDESSAAELRSWHTLYPLAIYRSVEREMFLLGSKSGNRRVVYVGVGSNRHDRMVPQRDHRALLSRILGSDIDQAAIDAWARKSQGEESPAAGTSLSAPKFIGEYEILTCIGSGAMGTVFRARQPQTRRTVALKRLSNVGNPTAINRFSREIEALGRVDHPNVARIYSAGTDGVDRFYAMELIEGTDLSRVWENLSRRATDAISHDDWQSAVSTACSDARTAEELIVTEIDEFDPPDNHVSVRFPVASPGQAAGTGHVACVVELIRKVALAAQALHDAGIVHRDIKPANIMLTLDGEPVLVDLGLAQLSNNDRITKTRFWVGTLRYTSPEQMLAADRVDCRSDIYSVGATLWELLTLKPMFDVAENKTSRNLRHADDPKDAQLMRHVMRTVPAPVSRLNSNVDPGLTAIVAKCLKKDETQRYGTARELVDDIGRWQQGKTVFAIVDGQSKRRFAAAARWGSAVLLCVTVLFATFRNDGAGIDGTTPNVASVTPALDDLDQSVTTESGINGANGSEAEAELPRAATGIRPDNQPSNRDAAANVRMMVPDPSSYGGVKSADDSATSRQTSPGLMAPGDDALAVEMRELARQMEPVLKKSDAHEVSLGAFYSSAGFIRGAPDRIRLALRDALEATGQRVTDRQAGHEINGEFALSERTDRDVPVVAIRITARLIEGNFGEVLFEQSRIVYGMSTIATLLGVSVALPPDRSLSEEAEQLAIAIHTATVYQDGTRVAATNQSKYSVEIVRGESGESLTLSEWDGVALAPLSTDEHFGVRLFNDGDHDAAVELLIDGVNSLSFLNRTTTHYIVPAHSSVLVSGWARDAQTVAAFQAVARLPSSVAANSRGDLNGSGTITALFSATWNDDADRPRDEPPTRTGTGMGPAVVATNSQTVHRRIGAIREVVTVRYLTESAAPEYAPEQIVWLFSCAAGEQAYELDELKHGVFTNAIVEQLQRAVSTPSKLSVDDLASAVKQHVRDQTAARFNAAQNPFLLGNFGEFPLTGTTTGRRLALVIGLNYTSNQTRNLQPLKYGVTDAKSMAASLEQNGYEVTLLTDESKSESLPTRDRVLSTFESLAAKLSSDDTLFVHFSGSGYDALSSGSLAQPAPSLTPAPRGYIIPADGILGRIDTMINLTEIERILNSRNVGRVFISIDACRVNLDAISTR